MGSKVRRRPQAPKATKGKSSTATRRIVEGQKGPVAYSRKGRGTWEQ